MKTHYHTVPSFLSSITAALTLVTCGSHLACGEALHLQYEWSPTAAGPYSPVPAADMTLHANGSASMLTKGEKGFFRLVVKAGAGSGGGAAVPVGTFQDLPPLTKSLVLSKFAAVRTDGSQEGSSWQQARLSPFVNPVTSAWNDSGVPDMVEIKIVGEPDAPAVGGLFPQEEGDRGSQDRGFILASVSRKNPPIVGYATEGRTPCENLLAHCQGEVAVIHRFGPQFIAAADAQGRVLGNRGLSPNVFEEAAYLEYGAPQSISWDAATGGGPTLLQKGTSPGTPRRFPDFATLLSAYRASHYLTARRLQKQALHEFDWQVLEGKAPTLSVTAGQRAAFLPGQTILKYTLDEEAVPRAATVSLRGAGNGINITGGATPGAYRLSVQNDRGQISRYMLKIVPVTAVRSEDTGYCVTSQVWTAGDAGNQPRYSQRKDLNRWCDAVGCGPVMLALQVGWAERNQNLPSAYWMRNPSATLTEKRLAARIEDSPMLYVTGVVDPNMLRWYDYFHDACDVICDPFSDNGATTPWDMSDAVQEYIGAARSTQRPLELLDTDLSRYMDGQYRCEIDSWGDDWDESGVLAATAIKNGRPAGVYYMEHWHYAMAYRYRKTTHEIKNNGQAVFSFVERFFRVNNGWGNGENKDAVWNAYDIDGAFTINLWQLRLPPQ